MERQMVETSVRDFKDLDRIDLQILEELQTAGRLRVCELARRVHLSTTPCLERMRRLEREGFIKDYVARLDARRMGFDFVAFVEVSLELTNVEGLKQFTHAIRELDEVVDCQMVTGNFDYLLKVNVVSRGAFHHFLLEKLHCLPGLKQTRTYLALEEVKAMTRLPTLRASARNKSRRRKG
jgi:Lrp/AsnC family transcriptional regulator, leucine-responsive regulatory protein